MPFDVLASIEVTASAAIAMAVLATGFGEDVRARVRIATGLTAWLVLVTVMAATGLLQYERGLGVAGVGLAVIVPIVILSVRVLTSPALFRALRTIPLSMLVGVNAIRLFGATFLVLHEAGRLPAPFAPVAGWGDIVIGLTALPVAWLALRKGTGARWAVLAWNTAGLADLIAAVGLGVISSPGPLRMIVAEPGSGIMSTLPWLLIPGFLVPLLASTHLAVFYRLARGGPLDSNEGGLLRASGALAGRA